MSATVVREKRQVTIPNDVFQAAGLHINDQVDWRFEDGEIRARKMVVESVVVLGIDDLDPVTLAPKVGKINLASLMESLRMDREEQ